MKEEERKIRKFIDSIEPKLESLWNDLASLKTYDNSVSIEFILLFQSELAEILAQINNHYHNLSKIDKSHKSNRNSLRKDDFNAANEIIQSCINALKSLIYICKSMGDAFAWFFYQNEKDILNEHLQRQEQLLLPSGYQGRIGELSLIKEVKQIKSNFLLYHGITSILRIGDFSLIDLKQLKLTSLAELKTHHIKGNKVQLSLHLLGQKKIINKFIGNNNRKAKTNSKKNDSLNLNKLASSGSKFKERLDKQMGDMAKALKVYSDENPKVEKTIIGKTNIQQLDNFVTNLDKSEFGEFQKIDDGLIVILVKSSGNKLSNRLFEQPNLDFIKSSKFKELVFSCLDSTSQFNSQLINYIHYNQKGINTALGMKPLFWENISSETVKKIYFREVVAITYYNPVFLKKKLDDLGYVYEYSEITKEKSFVKKSSESVLVLENIGYFISLVSKYLQNESEVIKMIDEIEITIKEQKIKTNSKINLNFFHI
jgi:hypothetical protein